MQESPAVTKQPSKPRSWLRFSLRTLLLLTAVMAAWLGVESNKAQKQRAAVAAIRDVGGEVTYNSFDGLVREISQPSAQNESAKLRHKWVRKLIGEEHFREVFSVELRRSEVTPEMISHLKCLHSLERVVVSSESTDVKEIQQQLPGVRLYVRLPRSN